MYRKFKANRLFTGIEMLGADAVLVMSEDGVVVDIVHDDDPYVEFIEGILCPGLVNAHCHLELSHLKGRIPKHTGLVNFVQLVMKERGAEADLKHAAMVMALKEMEEGGIVAVGDICNTADSVAIKAGSNTLFRNFVEVSGFVDATARKRLDEAVKIRDEFEKAHIVPHAPYSVSKSLFENIAALQEPFVSIHNQESEEEDLLYQNKFGEFLQLYENFGINISSFSATGRSSFRSWLSYFSAEPRIISVHNTFTSSSDLEFLKITDRRVWFCLCPRANLYIENALPPVDLFRKNNCKIVIGTDSYASNDSLSMAGEIKLLEEKFTNIPVVELLSWATVNGAEALGFEGLGRFSPGCKPGVVQLSVEENGTLTGEANRLL